MDYDDKEDLEQIDEKTQRIYAYLKALHSGVLYSLVFYSGRYPVISYPFEDAEVLLIGQSRPSRALANLLAREFDLLDDLGCAAAFDRPL
jgi:hypothetical protein